MALRQKPASIGLSLDAEGWVPVQVLLNTLDQPGPSAAKVLAPVRARIDEVRGRAQTPWESRSRTGNFIFNAPVNMTVQPGSKPGAAPTINPNSRVMRIRVVQNKRRRDEDVAHVRYALQCVSSCSERSVDLSAGLACGASQTSDTGWCYRQAGTCPHDFERDCYR